MHLEEAKDSRLRKHTVKDGVHAAVTQLITGEAGGTYIHLHFVHSLLEFSRAILVAGDHFSETVLHHC